MDANTLRRYFANIYSRKDFFNISSAFHQKENDLYLQEQLKAHWMDFDESELPDVQLNSILDKVQHRIYLDENRKRKKRVVSFLQVAQRIAAILFLPLLITSVIYNNWYPRNKQTQTSWAEIQCPLGVRTKFHLPDGSTGYLNSGSVLKYPVSFENSRNVVLSGEGYFDVRHNENSPFHVKTRNLDIKVLGTSFNVVAYNDEKSEEIILQTGHVDVSDQNGNKIASLTPDERLVVEMENKKFNLGKVVSEQYTAWKEGKLMFRNERIEDVAVRLGRWYNAEILIDQTDARIKTYTFHGTFVDEQLDDVLKILSLGAPISYREMARVIDNNGTYTKRKIIFSINQNKIKEFE
jgi:ferric-dicitrate binding protein FerR (iron transport regulator)